MKEQSVHILKVDQQLTFSVNTQIKEQLKWLIGTGHIEPGDMLPAASQLADRLGLNRNTVNWVYNQLRDEGIVTMQKGKGTQVSGGAATEQLRRERMPMKRLLDTANREALEEGLSLSSFYTAALAYTLLGSEPSAPDRPIWLIECKEHDHPFYRNEIKRVTGRTVLTLFVEDLKGGASAEAAASLDSGLIVTTLNHAEEVKRLLAPLDQKVHVIGASVNPSLFLEAAKLQRDAHVSFVCLGKAGGEWMARRVMDAGLTGIQASAIGIHDNEQLEAALQRSAKIYASAAVYDKLRLQAPDKVELFPMRLEQSSENLLQEISSQS